MFLNESVLHVGVRRDTHRKQKVLEHWMNTCCWQEISALGHGFSSHQVQDVFSVLRIQDKGLPLKSAIRCVKRDENGLWTRIVNYDVGDTSHLLLS